MNIKTKEKIIQLWQEYNAIMANAWPGDEQEILDQIEALGGRRIKKKKNA